MEKTQIKKIRAELNQALNQVAEKHGWKIQIGTISYSDTSMRMLKLEILFDADEEQKKIDDSWVDVYPQYKPGAEIEIAGKKAVVVKWKKNGAILVRKPGNPKLYVLTSNAVRRMANPGRLNINFK